MSHPFLVLDTASPVVSIALGDGTSAPQTRTIELQRSSEKLLPQIAEALDEAHLELGELGAVVALRGPGSFTGLRVGLATVLGLHQATGLAATAIPTLPVLAAAAGAGPGSLVAAVDALRGEWYAQRFSGDGTARADGEAALRSPAQIAAWRPRRVIGFGVEALADVVDDDTIELIEAPPLAAVALGLVARQPARLVWDAQLLTDPIYFRPPAVTLPKQR